MTNKFYYFINCEICVIFGTNCETRQYWLPQLQVVFKLSWDWKFGTLNNINVNWDEHYPIFDLNSKETKTYAKYMPYMQLLWVVSYAWTWLQTNFKLGYWKFSDIKFLYNLRDFQFDRTLFKVWTNLICSGWLSCREGGAAGRGCYCYYPPWNCAIL